MIILYIQFAFNEFHHSSSSL